MARKTLKIGSRGRPFRSYHEALVEVTRTSPRRANGYALDSVGHRAKLYPDGVIVIAHGGARNVKPRVELRPDETVTLHFPTRADGKLSTFFGNGPHMFVGLHIVRKSKGRYAAIHDVVIQAQGTFKYRVHRDWNPATKTYRTIEVAEMAWSAWSLWARPGYKDPDGEPIPNRKHLFWELCDGAVFNLATGQPLLSLQVVNKKDPEADRQWRRQLSRIKKVWKMRQLLDQGRSFEQAPRGWGVILTITPQMLADAIMAGDFGPDLPHRILAAGKNQYGWMTQPGWGGKPPKLTTVEAAIRSFDYVYNRYRNEVREIVGASSTVRLQVRAAA